MEQIHCVSLDPWAMGVLGPYPFSEAGDAVKRAVGFAASITGSTVQHILPPWGASVQVCQCSQVERTPTTQRRASAITYTSAGTADEAVCREREV